MFKSIVSSLLLATLASSSPVPQLPFDPLGRAPLPGMPMPTMTSSDLGSLPTMDPGMPMPPLSTTVTLSPAIPTSTAIPILNPPAPPTVPGMPVPAMPVPAMPLPATPTMNPGQYVFTDCSSAPALARGSPTLTQCVSNACSIHTPQTKSLLDGCTQLAAGALATHHGSLPPNW